MAFHFEYMSSLTVLYCILLDEISKIEKLLFTGRREQKTVRWITFNPLLEKGHYHGAKGYPGNSSTRTFKHLQETVYTLLMHKISPLLSCTNFVALIFIFFLRLKSLVIPYPL